MKSGGICLSLYNLLDKVARLVSQGNAWPDFNSVKVSPNVLIREMGKWGPRDRV